MLTTQNSTNLQGHDEDIAALAKGGRTNVFGFLLRLAARIPFLFIAGRYYGAETLGRFAYAILVVEFAAQLGTIGLRRGLAEMLSRDDRPQSHIVADAIFVALCVSFIGAAFFIDVPQIMFPNSGINGMDRFLPLCIFAIVITEIVLAAQAYKFDIAASVRARAVVEPWTISIAAFALFYYSARDGLILAYIASIIAGMFTALWPFMKSYGIPYGWRPSFSRSIMLARRNLPLAIADAAEWGSRRLDLAILGLFASPAIVGVYYGAQQVASLPQKLKTSFDPILGPVITRNLKQNRLSDIAAQVSQVGFWIIGAQAGIALALGLTGDAVMSLIGPNFVGGTAALAFLLAAEVAAATAVVSESALIYMARHRNLMISLLILGVQVILSIGFIEGLAFFPIAEEVRGFYIAAAVAAALMVSLGISSIIKSIFLSKLLGAPIGVWRGALLWAVAFTTVVGLLVTKLPEWAELVFGIPLLLGIYGTIIWYRGFKEEDRILFKKAKPADEAVK
ncbi:lipopolysaccharide biosynthesis protein [Sphingorhabdus lutea]|nr:polysaccharide biosynthesis protein [Sphingorhabdus lutea]